jgi:hypothetical protein
MKLGRFSGIYVYPKSGLLQGCKLVRGELHHQTLLLVVNLPNIVFSGYLL